MGCGRRGTQGLDLQSDFLTFSPPGRNLNRYRDFSLRRESLVRSYSDYHSTGNTFLLNVFHVSLNNSNAVMSYYADLPTTYV